MYGYNSIMIPAHLENFVQSDSYDYDGFIWTNENGKSHIAIKGSLDQPGWNGTDRVICPHCQSVMERHGFNEVKLTHVPYMSCWYREVFNEETGLFDRRYTPIERTEIWVRKRKYYCPHCRKLIMEPVPFKAGRHMVTNQLYELVCMHMQQGLTIAQCAEITGLHQHTVKAIDKERLERLYTVDGKGEELKKPDRQARFLGIDEFKLHKGHQYATHIMDLETGHVLYVHPGKGRDVVENFIDFVGEEWMKGVKAIACDMNAGFSNAFTDRFPHLTVVFDRFHVIKHFNEDVIGQLRKDLEKELIKEGRTEEAKRLKKGRYILTAGRDTLAEKDRAAAEQQAAEERRATELQEAQDNGNAARQQAAAGASEATAAPGTAGSDQQSDIQADQPLQTAPANASEGTAAAGKTGADQQLDLQDVEQWQISTTEASEAATAANGATVADQKQQAGGNKKKSLFKRKVKKIRGGNIALLEQLLKDNKLLSVCDVLKEKLKHAYELEDYVEMSKEIEEIIGICLATGNKRFISFATMLNNHIDGILGHALYQISSGRVEGFNNKIKTLRRKAYGYNDDEYFFLKIIDISYRGHS